MTELVFQPSVLAKQQVSEAIIITGPARSGTTYLGKLLHSFTGVEYQFEPPMLIGLFPLINQMPQEQWQYLYESYLYEEFFVNALAGRAINTNRRDDSSIFNVKDQAKIEARLNNNFSKSAAQEKQKGHVIAFKIPTVAYLLPKLLNYYPQTRIIVTEREPSALIKSLLAKKSFSNEILSGGTDFWPSYRYKLSGSRTTNLPYWLQPELADYWLSLDELNRAAYYCIQTTNAGRKIGACSRIDYSALVSNTAQVVDNLAATLHLASGCKTLDLINEATPDKPVDTALINSLSLELRQQIKALFDV